MFDTDELRKSERGFGDLLAGHRCEDLIIQQRFIDSGQASELSSSGDLRHALRARRASRNFTAT